MSETGPAPAAGVAPSNPSVRFEPRDVSPRAILSALVGIGATIIVSVAVLWPVYEYLSSRRTAAALPVSPLLIPRTPPEPPEPRLQGSPGHAIPPELELKQMREAAEAQLNSYGWVDQEAGVARIPIGEAMKIFAEQEEKRQAEGQTGSPRRRPSSTGG